jgi:DNA-binding IscR family transcriptional regulator
MEVVNNAHHSQLTDLAMAKLSDLVSRSSEVTGVPVATVREISRRLREASLISTGKRGRYGGTDMAAGDAASLLTALLIARASAAPLNNITLLTKSHLQNLTCRGDDNGTHKWSKRLALRQLSRLKLGHTFGDAFIALIASISNGDLKRSIEKWNTDKQLGFAPNFEIKVEINKPTPTEEAKIEFRTPTTVQSMIYLPRGATVVYPPRNWSDVHDLCDDLRVSATISESTLKAIGDLLRSSETAPKADLVQR